MHKKNSKTSLLILFIDDKSKLLMRYLYTSMELSMCLPPKSPKIRKLNPILQKYSNNRR